jgi:hypothetical protein
MQCLLNAVTPMHLEMHMEIQTALIEISSDDKQNLETRVQAEALVSNMSVKYEQNRDSPNDRYLARNS